MVPRKTATRKVRAVSKLRLVKVRDAYSKSVVENVSRAGLEPNCRWREHTRYLPGAV